MSKDTGKTRSVSNQGKTSVYSISGESVGTVSLNPEIFERETKNDSLLHQAVQSLLAGQRNVVASAKTRGEVRGGGKKPWRQKGTGRARAGSIRSPLWRGGGVTFGPSSNRNFSKKINKRDRRLALFLSLSEKAKENKFFVVDKLEVEPKTKQAVALVNSLKKKIKDLSGKILIVTAQKNDSLIRASRNLRDVSVKTASSFNILDVLTNESVVAEKDALQIIEKTYLK